MLVGWCVATATAMAVLYGLYGHYNPYKPMDWHLAASYMALQRFSWSLAVAWVAFACINGYGGKWLSQGT